MATRKKASKVMIRQPSTAQPSTLALIAKRGKTHGDFRTQADISQALKRLVHGEAEEAFRNKTTNTIILNHWSTMTPVQQEGLEMILHKIARSLAGDANYKDHWDDIAGYAERVAEGC
jgi:hypothetical protein